MLSMHRAGQTVGVFDAKTRLSELLDQVAAGATIVITRHGQPIAKLVPYEAAIDAQAVRAAMTRLAELREATVRENGGMSAADIREAIHEGRR